MKERFLCMIMACVLAVSLTAGLFSVCGQTAKAYCDSNSAETADEAAADCLFPVPSGTAVKEKKGAVIDYSNAVDGYVMVQYREQTDKALRVQVEGPTAKYTYKLKAGEWMTLPLSDGNGSYKVSVFVCVEGNMYSKAASVSFTVTLKDEFIPFLYANAYVDFENAPNTMEMAEKLTEGLESTLDKVAAIYDYIISSFTYDEELAETVSGDYLPDLDQVLESKKGICFDYAALMAGMLRSQKIPAKLVVGYADDVYHAWVSVFSEENGWVDESVYFDGNTWMRMDPSFASLGKNNKQARAFIGDGNHYTEKYFY